MVPTDEATIREKGALGPGQLLAVDMEEGRLFHDSEIKNKLADSQPFGDWVSKITDLDKALSKVTEKAVFSGNELKKRQIAAGYSIEEIEQILISNSKGVDEVTFERELYVLRRRIEKSAADAGISDLYLASLSCRSIIYKGMMLAEQVAVFYPDLMDERFESTFAIYHQRYSTNTFPQWWLAQPFRMLAHNGEINTLKGNTNWMKSHEIRMASSAFGSLADDIKPIIPGGSSDSAALDAVFEVLVRAGRSAPMAKTMLVPESWSNQAKELPKKWRDMYSYCNSIMEP